MSKVKDEIEPLSTSIERPKVRRTKHAIELVLTIAYLMAAAFYVDSQREAFIEMSSADFGTFLSGVFAPLAFLWLVLGFFQQGDELRHSADALWLQGQELKHSVEQQRQLVEVAREQFQFESTMLKEQREEIARNAQPILRLRQTGSMGGSEGKRVYTFALANNGKPCTDVKIDVEGKSRMEKNLLSAGGNFDFNVELSFEKVDPFRITVDYLDERLLAGSKTFIVSGLNSVFEIKDVA